MSERFPVPKGKVVLAASVVAIVVIGSLAVVLTR